VLSHQAFALQVFKQVNLLHTLNFHLLLFLLKIARKYPKTQEVFQYMNGEKAIVYWTALEFCGLFHENVHKIYQS